mgnify:FL=1
MTTRKPYQKSADTSYETNRKLGHISFNLSNPDESALYKKWRSMENASAQAKEWLRSLPEKQNIGLN